MAQTLQKSGHKPMKTTLKLLALFFAAALTTTFAADLAGAHLPAALDPLSVFCAFVGSTAVLTVFSDYHRTRTVGAAALIAAEKSPHALAA